MKFCLFVFTVICMISSDAAFPRATKESRLNAIIKLTVQLVFGPVWITKALIPLV